MKNRIRLTEGQLHRVIKESVKKIITETCINSEEISHAVNALVDAIANKYALYGSAKSKVFNNIWNETRYTIDDIENSDIMTTNDDYMNHLLFKQYQQRVNQHS